MALNNKNCRTFTKPLNINISFRQTNAPSNLYTGFFIVSVFLQKKAILNRAEKIKDKVNYRLASLVTNKHDYQTLMINKGKHAQHSIISLN